MNKRLISVVTGTGSYNDLGLIRSLGEKAIPVFYLTDKEHIFPIHKSKYIAQTIYCDMTEDDFIEKLKALLHSQKAYGVIFPTSDITALYLDRNYAQLKELCFFSHACGQLEKEMDKLQMVSRAKEAGLNAPFSISADARSLPTTINYPCIIKPLSSVCGEKTDISICNNNSELSLAVKRYIEKHNNNIIIQDLVADIKQEIAVTGVCLPNNEVIIKGIVNKRCIMGNGSTVYGKYNIGVHKEMYDKIRNYIRDVGYVGIFDMEFLEDNLGKFHFIECNYRNGAYGYAVTAAGFNMPYILFKANTSQQWNEPNKLRSVVFMEERSYILNLLQKRISLWHWLKDVASTDVFLWFNWKDIKPYIRIPHFIKKFFVKK